MSDSLKVTQNEDGSFTLDWDKKDPEWSWMNNLTSKELQDIVEQVIREDANGQRLFTLFIRIFKKLDS